MIDVNERCPGLIGFERHEMIGRTVHALGLWADPKQGKRVIGMQEWLFSSGGNVEIRGAPGRGAPVDVSIPLQELAC